MVNNNKIKLKNVNNITKSIENDINYSQTISFILSNNICIGKYNSNKITSSLLSDMVSNFCFVFSNSDNLRDYSSDSKLDEILIVDDDENMLETLVEIFSNSDFKVVKASNGEDAVELAKMGNFKAILLDMKMPRLNGVDTLKEIMKEDNSKKVVMMTAFAVDHLEREAISEGAKKIFYKPLNIKELVDYLKSL